MTRERSQHGGMSGDVPMAHSTDDGPIRRRFSGGRQDNDGMTEIELDDADGDDGAIDRFDGHGGADDDDAHRQVLEMSATIEILTRDFENLQRELLDAYKKLQEYSDHDPRLHPRSRQASSPASPSKVGATIGGGIVSNAMAKLRTGGGSYDDCGCSHEEENQELKRIIDVKDTALKEALHERNEYKVRVERAESMLRDVQGGHGGGGGGGSHHHVRNGGGGGGGGLHVQASMRTGSFGGSTVPYGMASTSPVNLTPSLLASSSCGSSSASTSKGLPKHERFDSESSYQSKEDNELFWRRQYRDAVRMRKHHGHQQPASGSLSANDYSGGGSGSGGGGGGQGYHTTTGGAKPASLKIFYPNTNRHKGITDENVPFTRYIGISTRQNEIIKEQHRILS